MDWHGKAARDAEATRLPKHCLLGSCEFIAEGLSAPEEWRQRSTRPHENRIDVDELEFAIQLHPLLRIRMEHHRAPRGLQRIHMRAACEVTKAEGFGTPLKAFRERAHGHICPTLLDEALRQRKLIHGRIPQPQPS